MNLSDDFVDLDREQRAGGGDGEPAGPRFRKYSAVPSLPINAAYPKAVMPTAICLRTDKLSAKLSARSNSVDESGKWIAIASLVIRSAGSSCRVVTRMTPNSVSAIALNALNPMIHARTERSCIYSE